MCAHDVTLDSCSSVSFNMDFYSQDCNGVYLVYMFWTPTLGILGILLKNPPLKFLITRNFGGAGVIRRQARPAPMLEQNAQETVTLSKTRTAVAGSGFSKQTRLTE